MELDISRPQLNAPQALYQEMTEAELMLILASAQLYACEAHGMATEYYSALKKSRDSSIRARISGSTSVNPRSSSSNL